MPDNFCISFNHFSSLWWRQMLIIHSMHTVHCFQFSTICANWRRVNFSFREILLIIERTLFSKNKKNTDYLILVFGSPRSRNRSNLILIVIYILKLIVRVTKNRRLRTNALADGDQISQNHQITNNYPNAFKKIIPKDIFR